ncbi:MAG: hypothetical protein H3C36_10465 [Chitinophagaceae bacterium]|nr:hypothetical protein [Chitinophagaceae bacterium]MCZ2395919.1 hypothetical protein [Chitinophagales bacterium]
MRYLILLLSILGGVASNASAQEITVPQPAQDTLRDFEIIRGPSMRMIKTDTGTLQTLAGGAVVRQKGTTFFADSMALNLATRRMMAFGNIHISDGDTVHIYSGFLTYSGETKIALLRNNVRLTGKKGNLTTPELDYNLDQGIGNYYKGGKVINNKNVITSTEGTYYADTKDVYFKKNVKMDGPKNHIRTDTLVYNMNNAVLTFTTYTYLWNDEIEVITSQGSYNTDTGDAFFTRRSTVTDSTGRIYTADMMALEGATDNIQMEGNGVVIDSAEGFVLLSNQTFMDKKNNSVLATRKPILILTKDKDSTYTAADTIFTALAKTVDNKLFYANDSTTAISGRQSEKIDSVKADSSAGLLNKGIIHTTADSAKPRPILLPKDTLSAPEVVAIQDSTGHKKISPADTLHNRTIPPALQETQDTNNLARKPLMERSPTEKIDSTAPVQTTHPVSDSLNNQTSTDSLRQSDDSIRYFMAFHNVRIYNDSLQSVCDSLFFSTRDSVFRLYKNPVVWSKNSQVSGDTMFLFTKNKEADRLYVFDRAMVVNQTPEGFFNQLSGKTLNAYFLDQKFDHIRVKGSPGESVYYLQDEDSSYIGMKRASADAIDMLFKKGELNKVIYINQVKGKAYPMSQIPEDQKLLNGFEWLDNRRPKSRTDLFR